MSERKNKNKVLTYGEAYAQRQEDLYNYKYTFDNCPMLKPHNDRMPRAKAVKYYNNKLEKVFDNLGYEKVGTRLKDFDTTEDYYDYHEAKKLKELLWEKN